MSQSAHQNTIAIVWDFDKTLIPNYMQTPLFEKYGIDEATFWKENNSLKQLYKEQGIRINPDTMYLNHLLTYVKEGICPDLNNDVLRTLGQQLPFFEGLPTFFEESKNCISSDAHFSKFDIKLEHYIVSTGLTEMIKGSVIAPFVDGIWGCEFIESPFVPVNGKLELKEAKTKTLSSIAYTIDNTTKTRALFEINKGANVYESVDVNQQMSEQDRRVPFHNMIYVADGPSDVPAFSVVKKGGGKAFAVYNKAHLKSFEQVVHLQEDGRVDMMGEADYRQGTTTYLWLMSQIRKMAENIVNQKTAQLEKGKDGIPKHIV